MSVNGKNRPGTIINWYDQLASTNAIEETIIRPLYFQLFTSDKGPETLHTIHGNEFFSLYGSNPSFKKHGQPLLQAAEIIKAGGEVLCKRVVAEDATLANLVVLAKVTNESVQKTDASGNALYIDADTGKETTEAAGGLNERAMVNVAKVKYDAVSVSGAKTLSEVKAQAANLVKDEVAAEFLTGYENTTKVGDPLTDKNTVGQVNDTGEEDYNAYIYPLFVVVDNGRGVSSKRFNIVPDYAVSKALNFQLYKLNFIGDTEGENEYVWFNFQDDVVYLNKNRSLNNIGRELTQIKAASFEDSIDLFIKRLSAITGIDEAELNSNDAIFGCTRKGDKISQIIIDTEEGYALNSSLGMMLQSGDNGAFGDAPINAATYGAEMVKVINGTYDDSIFDVDRFMIDVCVDANYPAEVKAAIFELADWRQDFIYLRDYGTNHSTYESVANAWFDYPKSKFVADYPQSWDVIDPWTKKQITVTSTYSMAPKLVVHLNDRRSAPLCGILYGFTFPNVVEGTVSFLPKITPKVDQKTLLSDNNINYASYVNGTLTMETSYTSKEGIGMQTRYINNILAVTKLIHNIRTECPKFRYSFITANDLDKYQEDVNNVIKRSNIDFATIYMQYTQDEVMAANKIFEADIFVRFKNFEQEEIFNIYTLS